MKANFILGKKQIILASLVVILGAAVYLNWQFANNSADLDITNQVDATVSETEKNKIKDKKVAANAAAASSNTSAVKTEAKNQKSKILGDAKFVSSKAIADETYFTMAKLARTRSRDEAIETVSTILDNGQLTEADKEKASAKAMSISDAIEAESRIENLVKAKGFSECMAYITKASANVVVQSDGLTQDQATQIKNIVVAEGSIKGENVSITEIK